MTSELIIKISDSPKPEAKVVSFAGEMDETNVEQARKDLTPLLNDSSIKTLVFDFKNLKFINSKGIGYLVSVHTHLAKDHRKLVLTQAQEAVMDVINLIGLTSIISYYETVEEALSPQAS
ncbi:MAG: STAS domain-containing protein [Candidatus Peregrinibacteria bacterium]